MSLSSMISRLLFQMSRELYTKTHLDDSQVKYASLVPVFDYDEGEMKTACSAIGKRLPYSIGLEVPEDYLRRQYEGKGVCLPEFFTPLALYCQKLGIDVVPLLSPEHYDSRHVLGQAKALRFEPAEKVRKYVVDVRTELQRLRKEHNCDYSPELISDPLRIYERTLERVLHHVEFVRDDVDLHVNWVVCVDRIKAGMIQRIENARPDIVVMSADHVDDVIKQVNDRNRRYVLERFTKLL